MDYLSFNSGTMIVVVIDHFCRLLLFLLFLMPYLLLVYISIFSYA